MLTIQGVSRDRLDGVLMSWEGTPRMAGQRAKGVGTDCAGFVAGVLEELTNDKMDSIPLETSFQVRTTAESAYKSFLKSFPADVVEGDVLEPGDVILVGRSTRGLEHALFAGNKYLWHCGHSSVQKTGTILQGGMVVKKILRYKDKGGW